MNATAAKLWSIGRLSELTQAMPDELLAIASELQLTRLEIDGVVYFVDGQAARIRGRLAELRGTPTPPMIIT
jgi:hypothetical protein